MFIKMDIKEYYLSEDHTMLAELVASFFDDQPTLKAWLKDCVMHLLDSQYVELKLDECTMQKVTGGSGMGMKHSGTISDLAFLKVAELPVLQDKERLGIQMFVRYRDDILTIVENPHCCTAFYECLIPKAAMAYKVEVESYSLESINMLDMTLYKLRSETGVRLAWRPFVKPSALHVPLSSTSMLANSIHKSWPVAEISRMYRRSLSKEHFEAARARMIAGFRGFFLSGAIRRCEQWQAPCRSSIATEPARGAAPPSKIVRLILPFSPRLRGLPTKLLRLHEQWNITFEQLSFSFSCSTVWCKGGKSLLEIARNHGW